jgi:serine/threonine protein kinase
MRDAICSTFQSEIALLQDLHHKNIVQYIDHIQGPIDYVVMEYALRLSAVR